MTHAREALVVEDLHKSFGALEVLKGISMTAHEHDVVSILGSSGSRKSTLLRCINLLEIPNAGDVTVQGELIRMRRVPSREPVPEDHRQVERIRAMLGMVFQQFNLWSHMTVLQNVVEAPRHVRGLPNAQATERAEAVLERVGMYDRKVYIYVFRGTPLLIQMYIIYYGLAQFEVVRESLLWPVLREAYWCALLSFALNTAAYTGEILRGAIANTPHGEVEAARSVGMSGWKLHSRIVLPSAFRRALPAYGNEVIFMLHGCALAGVITLVDLFGAARIVNSRHFVPFESFIAAGAFYLCLTFLIAWLFKLWERHWHAHLHARDVTDAPPEPPATFSAR